MATNNERSLRHVTDVTDFEDNERVVVDIDGREVAIFEVDGEFHAVLNVCPHQGGPVGEGVVAGTIELSEGGTDVSDLQYSGENTHLSCPWHGWEFDLSTGCHRSEPGYRLPIYDVEVEDGIVYIDLER